MCDTSSDNDSEIEESSSDTRGAVCNVVVPERSKHQYNRAFTKFMKWKVSKNKKSINEEVLLAYFIDLADKSKPSSLWTIYSMLKSTLMLNNEVDISKYIRLNAFLKQRAQICKEVKKSKTFTPEEINRFLKEAHNNEHLLEKVVLIFGIVGACRRYELYNLLFTDVEVYANKILVKIHNSFKQTPTTKKYRVFTVTGSGFELCKKYISLRPDPCKINTFFIQYRDGKCRDHPVGINQLGNVGKSIAKFLELPDPELYTGHCFKRTSAKLLVYSDGDTLALKDCYGMTKTMPAAPGNDSIDSFCDHRAEAGNRVDTRSSLTLRDCNDLRTTTLPAPGGNDAIDSFCNNRAEVGNRIDTCTSTPEGCSNNFLKGCNVQEATHQFPNTFENQDFECVNINIPSGNLFDGYSSDSRDSKSNVWNDIQNAVTNKNNVGEKNYNAFKDSMKNNINKIVNINVPDITTNSIHESPLVCFNNCRIKNVNINYTK